MEKEKKIKLVKIVAIIIGIVYCAIIIKYFFFIGGKEFHITFEVGDVISNSMEIGDKSMVRYIKHSGGGTFESYTFRALKPGTTTITFDQNRNSDIIKKVVYTITIDENLKTTESFEYK